MTAREPLPDDARGPSRAIGYTIAQAAHVLGISETSVRMGISSGTLQAHFDGRQWTVFLPTPAAHPVDENARDRLVPAGKQEAGAALEPKAPATKRQLETRLPVATSTEAAATGRPPYGIARTPGDTSGVLLPVPPRRSPAPHIMVGVFLALAAALVTGYGLSWMAVSWFNGRGDVLAWARPSETPIPSGPSAALLASRPTATPLSTAPTVPQGIAAVRPGGVEPRQPSAPAAPGDAAVTPSIAGPSAQASCAAEVRAVPQGASPPAVEPTVSAMLRKLRAAEAALCSGWLQATLDYTAGTTASTEVRFDLGTDITPARVQTLTEYESGSGVSRLEQVAIGDQAWQRQDTSGWAELVNHEGVWGQIQAFLPRAQAATNTSIRPGGGEDAVQWYDAARNEDVIVVVDADSGVPRTMRRVSRTSRTVFEVVYHGWNTPVQVTAP